MKQLTCEMCGSTDLVKQDGMYVCQSCGTKYSVEEAKKMMIEGTVDVSGSIVRVDNSASIANYLKMAKSAYDSSNQKEAESYCNKIIEIDPNNYQAWLLKGKAAGWQSTLANIRIEESVNCFTKAIENAPEDAVEEVKKTASDEISNLSTALVTLCCNNYAKSGSVNSAESIITNTTNVQLYALMLLTKCGVTPKELESTFALKINAAAVSAYGEIKKDYWGSTGHPSKVAWDYYTNKAWKAIEVIEYAIKLSDDDDKEDKVRYKNIIFILEELKKSSSYTYSNGGWHIDHYYTGEGKQKIIDLMMDYHKKIKEIDPNYEVPAAPQPTENGGCYVATAVYGSYDCPQVWTLRRYRDYTLAETWYGRAFIRTYYAISPTLVKWFGHTEWFKKMWKGKLDRMVADLNAEGVKDTPYEDRNW